MAGSMTVEPPIKVLMLLHDDWRHDSRVIREADALSTNGYDVTVLCRRTGLVEKTDEYKNSVRYCCTPASATNRIATAKALYWHFRVATSWLDSYPQERGVVCRELGWILKILGLVIAKDIGKLLAKIFSIFLWHEHPVVEKVRDHRAKLLAIRIEAISFLNFFTVDYLSYVNEFKPQVIHAHDVITLSCACLAGARAKIPVIYDAHELHPHTNYALHKRTYEMIERYEKTLLPRCAKTITVSSAIAQWMRDAYQIPLPALVMNTPDLSSPQGPSKKTDVRDTLKIDRDTGLAVYVGSVTIDRGLEKCLDAIALLPGVHFACVGPRYKLVADKLIARAARLGITERVHFIDPVPSEEVVSYIQTASCSLIMIQNTCLSYYYCFPNKLLESVFARVPVVAANLVEMSRFVERFEVGVVVDETDAAAISRGIQKVLETHETFRASTETLELVAHEFGWNTQASALQLLYNQLGLNDDLDATTEKQV